ncbi:MAG: class I SAM-dependent methyltransferase [Phycisphaerales bacterium]
MTHTILQWMDLARSVGRSGAFNARTLRRRERLRDTYAIVARSLMQHRDFQSAFDVGCANGFKLEVFLDAGIRVGGIDLSPDVLDVIPPALRPFVQAADFAEAAGRWDLVTCVEMAEHIRPGRSGELVEVVTRLAERWIYFSAAPPGQLGHGHINLRPQADWLQLFAERGWARDDARTKAVKHDLAGLEAAPWLAANVIILAPAWLP